MSAKVALEFVVCLARNGVIGSNGAMPWHFRADLQHFKALTTGHSVLMGRRTLQSIGRVLPNRRNIVLTSQPEAVNREFPAAVCVGSVQEALQLCADSHEDKLMVIGGGQLYRELLPQASVLHLTVIDRDFAGDTYFPSREEITKLFTLTESEKHVDPENGFTYFFETWALTAI